VADLVERLRSTIEGPNGVEAIEHYEREHPNIRAALAFAVAAGDARLANRLTAFVWKFWVVRSHGDEALQWLQRVLHLPGDVSPALRLEGIFAASSFAIASHDLDEGERWAHEGLGLARAASEALQEARMLMCLGRVSEQRDELPAAARFFDDALAIVRAWSVPDSYPEHMLALFLIYRSDVALLEGDIEYALHLNDEAHRIWIRRNDPWGIGVSTESRASIAVIRRHFDEAVILYRACAKIHHDLGARHGRASALIGLGLVAAGTGRYVAATSFFGASERVQTELSVPAPNGLRREYAAALRSSRATLGERQFEAAWQAGRGRSLEDALAEALAILTPSGPDRLLSKRELDVLALLDKGESNQAIADRLFLSPRTVESHVSSILTKLDVPSRQKAVTAARERGLLDAD